MLQPTHLFASLVKSFGSAIQVQKIASLNQPQMSVDVNAPYFDTQDLVLKTSMT